MEKEYWLDKWQSKDVAFHEQRINPDLMTYIHTLNLHSGDYIFVPLCGKTKDMLWLADEGFRVIGLELSPIACDEFFLEMNVTPQITQRAKFTSYKHQNIELLCGDLFDLTSHDLPTIQAIYDCKALIALPEETRKKYVSHMISCFGNHLKILLLTRESSCQITPPPYSVDNAEVKLLYGSHFEVQRLKHASIDKIPERLIKKGYKEMSESVYLMSERSS